jgi:hypothetical protein
MGEAGYKLASILRRQLGAVSNRLARHVAGEAALEDRSHERAAERAAYLSHRVEKARSGAGLSVMIRTSSEVGTETNSSTPLMTSPMTKTILSVPSPGRCRSGNQRRRTIAPTMMAHVPMGSVE